jgi:hypothetical protein
LRSKAVPHLECRRIRTHSHVTARTTCIRDRASYRRAHLYERQRHVVFLFRRGPYYRCLAERGSPTKWDYSQARRFA